MRRKAWAFGGAGAAVGIIVVALVERHAAAQAGRPQVPLFEPDPLWSQALPNKRVTGQVGGLAVDSHGNLWVFHRPATIPDGEKAASLVPPQAECCIPAPAVLEFDTNGKFLQAWGGAGQGYEWFTSEHGIFVDDKNNVWLSGNAKEDNQLLKFTNKGKFLMQIGHAGKNRGSNDTENLGGPAGLFVYRKTNELFVADGYFNHRVIVFDADTGAYRRHWGAYGRKPDDAYFQNAGERLPGPFNGAVQHEDRPSQYEPAGPPPPQFRVVHAARISNDGFVYVCDRTNDRIQVFKKDGTFVKEAFVAKETLGSGSVWDVAFSPDRAQSFLIVPDGTNQVIRIMRRDSLDVVGEFGSGGHWAGQFYGAHNIASDSKGNVYITETYEGKRFQKFVDQLH